MMKNILKDMVELTRKYGYETAYLGTPPDQRNAWPKNDKCETAHNQNLIFFIVKRSCELYSAAGAFNGPAHKIALFTDFGK